MSDAAVDVPSEDSQVVPKKYLFAFVVVTCLFALWGAANNMTDLLLAAFKKVMSMSDSQTSWIQIAFYGAYFCLALPGAIFIRKYSYKAGLILGLAMYGAGAALCYPASQTLQYSHFLAAFYILAAGCSILETAANPYILSMGPPETATQRLNLAQSFNPIGSILGIILGKTVFLSQLDEADEASRAAMTSEQLQAIQTQELGAVSTAYVIIAAVAGALLLTMLVSKFPSGSDTPAKDSLGATFGRLFKEKHWVMSVIAQFLYVGAQVGIWSFTIRYVQAETGLNEDDASTYQLAAIIVFSVSRFICTFLMKYIAPHTLLWILALVAASLLSVVVFGSGMPAIYCLVATSACMSLMFPTIYGLGLHGLGEDTKIGASGLIMAILGAAALTWVQGKISDASNIHYAYLLPLSCFLFIAYYGMSGYKADDRHYAS